MHLKKIFMHPIFAALNLVILMGLYFFACYFMRFRYGLYNLDQVGATDALTYLFFGMTFATLIALQGDYRHTPRQSTYFTLIFLWIVTLLREMGMQHWLAINDTTAIKINYFKNPAVPFYGKVISACIILAVVWAIGFLFYKNFKVMVREFFKLNPVYWTIATFGVWGVTTQIADRLNSIYTKHMGQHLSEPTRFFISIVEEGGESLLPILFIIALVQFHFQLRQTRYL